MVKESLGVMSFPGINQIVNGSYSLVHGVSPGVAQLTIAPQLNFIGAGGDLIIAYDDIRIILPDSKLDKHSFQRNKGGLTWKLHILDRRWKWRFPTISGTYNLRDEGNNLVKDSEKSPQELAQILLEAMGERNFKVDQLPNKTRPKVEWDFTNAANALATLCDSLGCRVVMHLNSIVTLELLGKGQSLPIRNVSISDNTGSIDPPERPGKLKVVGGLTRFQTDFQLFPVGLDTDGSIVPIEELSYAPLDGWAGTDPEYPFDDVFGNFLEVDLARATVYRWYRIILDDHAFEKFTVNAQTGVATLVLPTIIAGQFSDKFNAGPWEGDLERLEQILPLENAQVDTRIEGGIEVPKLAEIWGAWYDNQMGDEDNVRDDLVPYEETLEETPGAFYKRGFTLDAKKGLVKFSEPLFYKLENPETLERFDVAARLAIRIAVKFRDSKTRAFQRFELERKIGPDNTAAQIINRSEIVLQRKVTFSEMAIQKQSLEATDNKEDADKEANFHLDVAQKTLNEISNPESIGYNGIVPIDVDGAIHQVSWSVGPGGAKTRASFNEEQENIVRPYRIRRRNEREPSELTALKTALERKIAEDKEI